MIDEIEGHYLLSLAFANTSISDPEHALKRLRAINDNAEVQLVKADLIAGPEHLQIAAKNALASFHGAKPRSKSLAMEFLLYLSCQRQIARAIKFLGVGPEDSRIALVALSDSMNPLQDLDRHSRTIVGGEQDENLIGIGSKRKVARLRQAYGVTSREFEATRFEGETDMSVLKRLIVERSALLDLEN